MLTLALSAQAEDRVKLETSFGDILLELDAEKSPETVKNFLEYVNKGFYDGTIFHRVIKGFMIQGGGFTPDMNEKKTSPPIKNEADNTLKNLRGTIAMARTSIPDSATSQFFINTVDNHFLNFRSKTRDGWGYCVFGKVVEGMDVVDKIEGVSTANNGFNQNVPLRPVIIKKATVIKPEEKSVPAPTEKK
ncbi:MAG: peptidyl-prolyl cis-trans isomerase [Proteobacteria bacterium]|nr:peptidyl-prolyl cis-trans isomerase [Pseudomonadota bacterium]